MRPRRTQTFRDRPYAENWLDVDQYNMQVLKMIHAKYSSEYLPFFANLSTMYGNSQRGKEIREVVVWINRARITIEASVFSGRVTGEQATNLYEMVDKIEERKIYFLKQAEQVQAMQEKLDKVTETVGISPNDLNITRDMMKAGVRQARKKAGGEDFLSRMKGEQPGAHERLSRLAGGLKVAAFGPFTPVVDFANDIEKMIRGAFRKRGRPGMVDMPGGLPIPGRGGLGGIMPGSIGPVSESASLFQFFNTKAYKAKWTRELLDRIRSVGAAGKPGASGLIGLAGIMGKLGLIGASVASVLGIVKTISIRDELKRSGTTELAAAKRTSQSAKDWANHIKKEGETKVATSLGISVDQLRVRQSGMEKSAKEAERVAGIHKAGGIYTKELPGVTGLARMVEAVRHPTAKAVAQSQQEPRKLEGKPAKIDTAELDRIVKGAADEMKKLGKSVDRLSDNVGGNPPNIKPVLFGNPFDSADPLINQLASGRLTVGGK